MVMCDTANELRHKSGQDYMSEISLLKIRYEDSFERRKVYGDDKTVDSVQNSHDHHHTKFNRLPIER